MQPSDAFNRQQVCRHGQMIYNLNDSYIGRSLDVYGEYSEGEVELFRQVIKPGSVVIEVGANIGALTVPLAKLVTRNGVIVAFEPQRVVFQTLCANMALNSISNAYCFQQAIGAQAGAVFIPPLDYTRENNFGGLSLGSYESGERVPMSALDDFNFPACHFLKVDVEGMETEVLQGAKALISRFRPVLYVENDRPERSSELIRLIQSFGYKLYWHRPAYFNPANFRHKTENIFPDLGSFNMVCVHASLQQNLVGFEEVILK